MRPPTLLLSFLFALRAFSAPQPESTNAPLATADYDLAESVFRQYVSLDAYYVYYLSYGTNDAVLPADFMTRFKQQFPLVRSSPDGVTVASNSTEACAVSIRQLRVTGDKAEVQVLDFADSVRSSTRIYLVRERGRWRVKDSKMQWCYDSRDII